MKYKLAIFDLDGTLLNTLDDLRISVNHSLSMFGYMERTESDIKSFVGNGVHKLIERSLPDGTGEKDAEKVFEEFRKYYSAHCSDYTKPYDGIKELLNELLSCGMIIAVVSNKSDAEVKKLTRKYFGECVDAAIGEREGIRRKPCPDSVNELLMMLGTEHSEAIYIGDSEVDIETARNAEIDMIAVSWGFRSEQTLSESGASAIARDVGMLRKMLLDL